MFFVNFFHQYIDRYIVKIAIITIKIIFSPSLSSSVLGFVICAKCCFLTSKKRGPKGGLGVLGNARKKIIFLMMSSLNLNGFHEVVAGLPFPVICSAVTHTLHCS